MLVIHTMFFIHSKKKAHFLVALAEASLWLPHELAFTRLSFPALIVCLFKHCFQGKDLDMVKQSDSGFD